MEEAVLKNSRRPLVKKEEELLMGVARTIGSTLGTIVAKVSPASKSAGLRPRRSTTKKKTSSISRPARRKRSRKRS